MGTSARQSMPVIITAIIAVTVLEIYAMSKGFNGILLTLVIGAICALAGTKLGKVLEHRCIKKENKET